MISSLGLTPSNNFDASLQRFSICLPSNDAYRIGPSAGAKTHTDHSIISDFIGYEITRTIWQFAGRGCNTCGFAVMQSRKRDHRRFDDCIQCPDCLTVHSQRVFQRKSSDLNNDRKFNT